MKINDTRIEETKKFSDVKIGEVFFFAYNDDCGKAPYMKISAVLAADEWRVDAVNLISGRLKGVNGSERVIIVDSELIIK